MLSSFGDDLIRFVVLIVPGLWALWIYKSFLLQSTDEIIWEKDIVIAVSFALPGYLFVETFKNASDLPIAAQFGVSLFFAIFVSVVAGKLHRSGIHPFHLFAKWDSKKRPYSIDVPFGRGLTFIMNDLINEAKLRDGYTQVVLVYNLGNRENALIGELLYRDERFNEIVVDARPDINLEQIEKNHWDINPWVRSINLDSGLVVEVANVKNDVIRVIHNDYDTLKAKEFEHDV
jgi:hypothetical protein